MLGTLNSEQIEQILRSEVIGRIGCHANGQTYVVPITYAYDGERVICHTSQGRKIEPSQKSLGGLATKTQANDRETVSARSPRLTLAFWAMSFPKVGINFFPPTRSVRYSQKETPFLATSFFEAGESISTPSSIITAGTATDMHV